MKKLFLKFLLISLTIFSTNIAFWDCNSWCQIKDWPAEVLNNYLKNLRKLSNNFNTQISKLETTSWLTRDISKTRKNIQLSFNKIIEWDGYYSLFDFFVLYWTKNEYVVEIWRDYNLLEKENIALKKYLDRVIKRWYDEQKIDLVKLCSGVENCSFNSDIAFEVMAEIIKNHENVMDYYRLSIVWKRSDFSKDIIFAWANFKDEFATYYNEYTTSHCSQCEWATFDRIEKQIDIISNWQQSTKDWMKSWQDAIAMLDWTLDDRQYERQERKLLEAELRVNWTSLNASNNVLNNLAKYNENWWFSLDNNFITNTFDSIKNSVKSQIDSFTDTILEKFKNSSRKEIPTQEFSKSDYNLKTTSQIEEGIAQMYNNELPYANLQDNTTESLQSRIIELHYNLSQSIKNLDWTVKTSQKVCNDQWRWLWKCE